MINKSSQHTFKWHLSLLLISIGLFLLLALITALILEKHNKNLFSEFSSREYSQDYYSSYTSNQYKGYFALCSALKNQEIVLMGSSELHDQDSPFFPNKFFKEAIKQNLKSFGSKGFQVKIIASILSACLPYIAPNQSKLVIIGDVKNLV